VNEQGEQRLEPGHRLDRYELLCPIAQGGMASVWLARQHGKHGFEKLVAVKTILPLFAQDLRFQQMFLDEARIASGIEHANVAQILDLGEENDVLYIAMEWVDGDSLSKLFRAAEKVGQRLPVSIVCRIVSDACAGLHAAHELHDKGGELLNVVHRDVSPQNILVSTKGQAKLIDFGIAKARDRVAGDTSTGFLKGKILYMAPEQALGKPVDRRADVWAVGAVLYHMLAGVPPFEGANQLATLHLLTNDGGPPPLPAHVPPQVAEVVWRALTKDHARRVATAEDLQRLLEAAMYASGHTAIQADVAAFVNKQLVDRVEARRKAMDLALEAAKQRQKLQQMLKPTDADSASGIGHAFRTRSAPTPSDARIAAISSPETSDPTSSATLNSAAIVSPRPSIVPGTRKAIVYGVLGVCALVGAMATGVAIAGRHGAAATPSPPSPQPTQTATQAPLRTDIPKPPAVTAAPPPTTTAAEPVVTAVATATQQPVTTARPQPTATIARPKPTASSKATNSTKPIDDGF
jgi:serine/threonine-protein kinase